MASSASTSSDPSVSLVSSTEEQKSKIILNPKASKTIDPRHLQSWIPAIGERVWARDSFCVWYGAKVLDMNTRFDRLFLVTFEGWPSCQDEWVNQDNVQPYEIYAPYDSPTLNKNNLKLVKQTIETQQIKHWTQYMVDFLRSSWASSPQENPCKQCLAYSWMPKLEQIVEIDDGRNLKVNAIRLNSFDFVDPANNHGPVEVLGLSQLSKFATSYLEKHNLLETSADAVNLVSNGLETETTAIDKPDMGFIMVESKSEECLNDQVNTKSTNDPVDSNESNDSTGVPQTIATNLDAIDVAPVLVESSSSCGSEATDSTDAADVTSTPLVDPEPENLTNLSNLTDLTDSTNSTELSVEAPKVTDSIQDSEVVKALDTASSNAAESTNGLDPLHFQWWQPQMGEDVVAIDERNQWYGARIVDIDQGDGTVLPCYKVRYNGFTEKYDEWKKWSTRVEFLPFGVVNYYCCPGRVVYTHDVLGNKLELDSNLDGSILLWSQFMVNRLKQFQLSIAPTTMGLISTTFLGQCLSDVLRYRWFPRVGKPTLTDDGSVVKVDYYAPMMVKNKLEIVGMCTSLFRPTKTVMISQFRNYAKSQLLPAVNPDLHIVYWQPKVGDLIEAPDRTGCFHVAKIVAVTSENKFELAYLGYTEDFNEFHDKTSIFPLGTLFRASLPTFVFSQRRMARLSVELLSSCSTQPVFESDMPLDLALNRLKLFQYNFTELKDSLPLYTAKSEPPLVSQDTINSIQKQNQTILIPELDPELIPASISEPNLDSASVVKPTSLESPINDADANADVDVETNVNANVNVNTESAMDSSITTTTSTQIHEPQESHPQAPHIVAAELKTTKTVQSTEVTKAVEAIEAAEAAEDVQVAKDAEVQPKPECSDVCNTEQSNIVNENTGAKLWSPKVGDLVEAYDRNGAIYVARVDKQIDSSFRLAYQGYNQSYDETRQTRFLFPLGTFFKRPDPSFVFSRDSSARLHLISRSWGDMLQQYRPFTVAFADYCHRRWMNLVPIDALPKPKAIGTAIINVMGPDISDESAATVISVDSNNSSAQSLSSSSSSSSSATYSSSSYWNQGNLQFAQPQEDTSVTSAKPVITVNDLTCWDKVKTHQDAATLTKHRFAVVIRWTKPMIAGIDLAVIRRHIASTAQIAFNRYDNISSSCMIVRDNTLSEAVAIVEKIHGVIFESMIIYGGIMIPQPCVAVSVDSLFQSVLNRDDPAQNLEASLVTLKVLTPPIEQRMLDA